jgi:hypothetical protein
VLVVIRLSFAPLDDVGGRPTPIVCEYLPVDKYPLNCSILTFW